MEIHIDLSVVPPALELREPDDFKGFKVVVADAEHARVPVAALEQLAGDRASDPEWRGGLEQMLEYAQKHGFLDERGIRAHVERPA